MIDKRQRSEDKSFDPGSNAIDTHNGVDYDEYERLCRAMRGNLWVLGNLLHSILCERLKGTV